MKGVFVCYIDVNYYQYISYTVEPGYTVPFFSQIRKEHAKSMCPKHQYALLFISNLCHQHFEEKEPIGIRSHDPGQTFISKCEDKTIRGLPNDVMRPHTLT